MAKEVLMKFAGYRGLFNPAGCASCDLLHSVKQVVTTDELNGEPVEEYHLFDRLAKLQAEQSR